MPSVWINKRPRKGGGFSYRVMYRLGGHEESPRYAGAFRTKRDAETRRAWVSGEIAAMRVPDVRLLAPEPVEVVTLNQVADGWRVARIDASAGTRQRHEVELARILPTLGELEPKRITKAAVQELIGELSQRGLKRETIRKTISTLAMLLDHAEVSPNPARGVNLPEHDAEEVNPPTAKHVEAVVRLLPSAYRLPTIVLDQTGMRVGELEKLTWGDVDEQAGRWRVRRLSSKTRKARWVPVPVEVFVEVLALKPREDRNPDGQVFEGFAATAYRTSLTRTCKAAGIPQFSPHDLRHRRATLWHLAGHPAAEAAGWLGHSPQEHLRTYAHVMLERTEINLSATLGVEQTRHTERHTSPDETSLFAGRT